jgi:hypothetical protein
MSDKLEPMPKSPDEVYAHMNQMAHDYQVPVSEGTIRGILGDGGEDKIKPFEDYLKMTAQGLYPTLAKQIGAGIPTAFLLDPYRQVGKRVLGEDFEPDFIGNSGHARALSGGTDPATGRPTVMGLDQWAQHLKSDPQFGWLKSPDGIRERQRIVNTIIQGFKGEK